MLSDTDFDLLCKQCDLEKFNFSQPEEKSVDAELPVLTESELTSLLKKRSAQDSVALNFLAAGRFNNFIPSIIRARKLQSDNCSLKVYESNKATVEDKLKSLTKMPCCAVFNDDLASLLTNLLLDIKRSSVQAGIEVVSKILISATVSPSIRNVLRTQLKYHCIDLVVLDYDKNSGKLSLSQLQQFDTDEILAVVTGWPNYFGLLEDITEISHWAEKKGSQLIALSDPLSLSLIKSPFMISGGKLDYILGDLQAAGFTASQSGASPSFLASTKELSNNLKSAVTTQINFEDLAIIQLSMSVTGLSGLQHSAELSNSTLHKLVEKLTEIDGVEKKFISESLNECVIKIAGLDIEKGLKMLAGHNIVFGYILQNEYPGLTNCLLISCSDLHSNEDLEKLVSKVATMVKNLSTAGCPVKPKFNS
jgi:glycine dehydrogenase subunit 1